MGRFRLLGQILWNEKFMRLYMVAFTALLIISANISIALLKDEYNLKKIGEVCNFTDAVYFSTTLSPWHSEAWGKLDAVLDEMEGTGALVGKITGTSEYWGEIGEQVMLFQYDDVILQHVSLPLSEGSWLEEGRDNDAVLAYTYRWKYDVGDEIVFEWDGHHTMLHVVGFLDKDDYAMNFNYSGYVDIGDLIQPVEHAVITNGIRDEAGISIQSTWSFGASGVMIYGLPEEYEEALTEFGSITKMEEVSERYMEATDERFRGQLALEAVLVVLAITGLGTTNFISMYTRRREYGIYFIFGLSEKQVIWMTSLTNAFVVGSVFVCAVAVYLLRPSTLPGFDMINILGTLGIITFLLLITSIPFYLIMSRESVIDLTRR